MLARLGRVICCATMAAVMTACSDKPKHYYIFCDEYDESDWRLVDAEKDKNGYLLACVYLSPDSKQSYTARCTKDGCGRNYN